MNVQAAQKRLIQNHYNVGAADGVLGPKTYAAALAYTAQSKVINSIMVGVGQAMSAHLPNYGVTTALRLAHLMGQAAVETARFTTLQEFGGASYFRKYDGRSDLGNTRPGDGPRFHGRGLLQITGRFNYDLYSRVLGVDILANPDKAAEPDTGTLVGLCFWDRHGLNTLADADNCEAITKRINGGFTGLSDRRLLTARAKGLFA